MKLKDVIKKAAPNMTDANLEKYVPHLVELMPKYGIDTPIRQRHFLAQLLHESGEFAHVRENLNYSTDGLLKTFPKYFPTRQLAEQYARQPEKIANRVYANRMGNGDEASGDGWRHIGRGLIQTTGKDNYRAVSQALFNDDTLLREPAILEHPRWAVESATWFWKRHNLNQHADKNDIQSVTRTINGGLNGIYDRQKYFNNLVIQV